MDNEDINAQEEAQVENSQQEVPVEENTQNGDSPIDNSQLGKLKRRIKYDEDIFGSLENYEQVLSDLLEDSTYIGLSILFPFQDFSKIDFPERYYNWQIRCCVELYNMAGTSNIASYSENGLSWTKFKDGLSQSLINELISKVGTPKRVNTESESDTNV